MEAFLLWVGRLGGIAGAIICALAVLVRFLGIYNVAGFQVGTLLLAGIAATSLGCIGYLAAIAERRR